jgi:hypothetical protein
MLATNTRISLWHGATLGLALAVGLWLPEVIRLWGVPLRHFYPTLAVGSMALGLIGGVTGVLSARFSHAAFSSLLWLGAGLVSAWLIGGTLFQTQTLVAWLGDLRFWGQPIYEASSASQLRGGLAGFFIVLALAIYGLLQENRLDGLRAERDPRFGLTGRGWFVLLVGLAPLAGVGVIANEIVLKPVYTAAQVTNQAIRVVRSTEGDLLEVSQRDGVNYSGLRNERERLAGSYSLQIGQVEWGPINTVHIVVEFESGVWLFCHLQGDSLSHCNDASPPYLIGFPAFVGSGALPADCGACRFRFTEEQVAWMAARAETDAGGFEITKVNQLGDVVLMQARPGGANPGLRCFFKGIVPIVLQSCQDSES